MDVRDPICGMPVDTDKAKFKLTVRDKTYYFCCERCMRCFIEGPKIAYFSMEIGIKSDIPTYSGGLGVLAGDTIRSSADLKIPLTAVTLISRKGYLNQKFNEKGEQLDLPEEWKPEKYMRPLSTSVSVRIANRDVKIRAWAYDWQSPTGGMVPILLLDTDMEENSPEDRRITDFLYGGDNRYRLKQEIVLGIGGVRMLEALNFRLKKFHMNEGHSSLLILELLKKNDMNPEKVREKCVFTTHTPVAAAFDVYSYDLIKEFLDEEYPMDVIKKYGGNENLNMTVLALNLSKYINGVTIAHMEQSRKLFPGYHIRAITNGVHSGLWTCKAFRSLYDKYIPGWVNEPELLVRVDQIPNDEIWDAHIMAKKEMIDIINKSTGISMKPEVLTFGFARRATAYKRATLLFSDIERLKEINKKYKMQFVFAGKAHPRDIEGKNLIKAIIQHTKELRGQIEMVYLENYNMDLAAKLVSGSDVWLNTPMPTLEASGTSGMKTAHNGIPNFSVLDGWWIEGWIEDVTGWSIGPQLYEPMPENVRKAQEIRDIYNKIEYLIAPKFYNNRDEWIGMMKSAIGKGAYYFNTHRMMRRYASEAYL
jgi:starch phosphorylase